MTKSRGILARRRRWAEWELDMLRQHYPDKRGDWVARAVRRDLQSVYAMAKKLGLKKSEAFLASPDACRLRRGDNPGVAHRFPKGHVPANKGVKGQPSCSPATTFKKGNRPYNWVPVGSTSDSQDGYLTVKLREPNVWGFLHELVWASVHGWPRPPGTVIAFRDGNRQNCDPDNLFAMTRADNMARNTVQNLPEPIKQLIRARASLVRKINDHEQNRRPAKRALRADGQAGRGERPEDRDRALEGDG